MRNRFQPRSSARSIVAVFTVGLALAAMGCAECPRAPDLESARVLRGGVNAPGTRSPDEDTVIGPRHYLHAIPARAELSIDASGGRESDRNAVHVVVEIPAGTNAKFEVDKDSGALRLEQIDGRPRVVDFLAYPASYGMVPRTLLTKEDGGDGDPLDIVLLGTARARGEVVPARVLGVLRLLDRGEVDDKHIAVPADTPIPSFAALRDLEDLAARHPKVLPILELWFTGYKGEGTIVSRGYGSREEAEAILERAIRSYEAAVRKRVKVAWPENKRERGLARSSLSLSVSLLECERG